MAMATSCSTETLTSYIGRGTTLKELLQCSRHHRGVAIRECANLAVPAAGSTTLHHWLAYASRTRMASLSDGERRGRVHHAHSRRIPDLPGVRCVLMTLRDPVERMESAFRHEMINRNPFYTKLFSHTRRTTSVDKLVHALSEPSDPAHALLQRLWNASRVPRPVYRTPGGNASDFVVSGGNGFLVPQADYLRGLNCSATELHVLCQTNFSQAWDRLRARFGPEDWPPSPYDSREPVHVNVHRKVQGIGAATMSNPVHREYVRSCLYPVDMMLYRRFCSGPAAAR